MRGMSMLLWKFERFFESEVFWDLWRLWVIFCVFSHDERIIWEIRGFNFTLERFRLVPNSNEWVFYCSQEIVHRRVQGGYERLCDVRNESRDRKSKAFLRQFIFCGVSSRKLIDQSLHTSTQSDTSYLMHILWRHFSSDNISILSLFQVLSPF